MNSYIPVILGSDDNAYGTARLFSEITSVKPLLLCKLGLSQTADSRICDVNVIKDFDSDKVFAEKLPEILKKKKEEYGSVVLVPCSDNYSLLVSRHFDKIKDYVSNRFCSYDLIETLDTKNKFYDLCGKHGLDFPKTFVVTPEERASIVSDKSLTFPIVVKPENSNSYDYMHCSFEGKKKVYFFSEPESYLRLVSSLNGTDYKGKLIIQEFIPGGDDSMRVMNCYSDANGKVRAMCLGQPVLEEYAPGMIGNYASIITRSDDALYEKIRNFLESIGYVGFSNFDMKFDRRSGKYMLFEINPRLGRSSYFVRGSGINMMKVMTDDVIEKKDFPVIYGKTVSIWSSVPKYVLKHYITDPEVKKEALSLWKKGVSHTLFNKADKSFKRNLRVRKSYLGQIIVYKHHWFDKTKT